MKLSVALLAKIYITVSIGSQSLALSSDLGIGQLNGQLISTVQLNSQVQETIMITTLNSKTNIGRVFHFFVTQS